MQMCDSIVNCWNYWMLVLVKGLHAQNRRIVCRFWRNHRFVHKSKVSLYLYFVRHSGICLRVFVYVYVLNIVTVLVENGNIRPTVISIPKCSAGSTFAFVNILSDDSTGSLWLLSFFARPFLVCIIMWLCGMDGGTYACVMPVNVSWSYDFCVCMINMVGYKQGEWNVPACVLLLAALWCVWCGLCKYSSYSLADDYIQWLSPVFAFRAICPITLQNSLQLLAVLNNLNLQQAVRWRSFATS